VRKAAFADAILKKVIGENANTESGTHPSSTFDANHGIAPQTRPSLR
jgi:hypothetical protein